MFFGLAPPDPYILSDGPFFTTNRDTGGKTSRSFTINPALKTLVLFSMGESNRVNVNPTPVVPTHASAIDNLNVYDGGLYGGTGQLLGCSSAPVYGGGNLNLRLADLFITNGRFDRVILVPLAMGSTTIAMWATTPLSERFRVAMLRLAARGITPSTTGVTMAAEMALGANDNAASTSQASWAASFATFYASLTATGFNGRTFVSKETYNIGTTSSAIRAAQAGVVNSTTIFQSGDLDTLDSTNRQADNVHFNDAGAAAAATLIYNAMHATGGVF